MQSKFSSLTVSFFQKDKLNHLKLIKNRRFNFFITKALSRIRPIMTKFISKEEIMNLFMYSMYIEEVNINYIDTEYGDNLFTELSKFDYEKDNELKLDYFNIGDTGIEFIAIAASKKLKKTFFISN